MIYTYPYSFIDYCIIHLLDIVDIVPCYESLNQSFINKLVNVNINKRLI